MATIPRVDEPRFVLSGVDWETYQSLRNAPDNLRVRMTYDRGYLEFMSPSRRHERLAELWSRLIIVWTEERDIPIQGCGMMTCQRQDLKKGLEPDKCYYVAHEAQMRGSDDLDLQVDPPPDMVIEVDVTRSSRRKLAIYAALGVPEVWHWRAGRMRVLVLNSAGAYEERPASECLPGFPFEEAEQVLQQQIKMDDTTVARTFRALIRH